MIRFAVILILTAIGCSSQGSSDNTLLLTEIQVVDVANGILLGDRDVEIQGDRIARIVPGGSLDASRFSQVFRGKGKFLIPGLWDMHAHPDDPELWRSNPDPASRETLLPLFVIHGITGIRDMGGSLMVIRDWRERSRRGEILAPEIVACGPLLDGPNPMWDGSVSINSPAEVKHIVDSLVALGVDFLKVYSLLPRGTYFALAAYARDANVPLAGHVPIDVLPSEAARSGMRSQEHFLEILSECATITVGDGSGEKQLQKQTNSFERSAQKIRLLLKNYDERKADKLFELFAETHTYHTPTISMWYNNAHYEQEVERKDSLIWYLPAYLRAYWRPASNDHLKGREVPSFIASKKELVDQYMRWIRDMSEAGIPLLAGTDMGANPLCLPGWSLHEELELFVKAGLTADEALRTATLYPAEYLELHDTGVVEERKRADLVILEANPLVKITNTRKIAAVIRNGKLIRRDSLNQIAAMIKEHNNKW